MSLFFALIVTAAPELDLEAFFKVFDERRAGVHALSADFVQENVTPDETSEATGAILYARPRRIIFRYDSEESPYALLLDGLRVYEYEADLGELKVVDLEDDPQMEALFLGFETDVERLREAYDISTFDPADEPGAAFGLVLRPRMNEEDAAEEGAEPLFERVRLWLRDKDYLPIKIQIVNDRETQSVMRIENLEVNPALTPEMTQLEIAPDTKIIENEEFVETVGAEGAHVPEALLPPPADPAAPVESATEAP